MKLKFKRAEGQKGFGLNIKNIRNNLERGYKSMETRKSGEDVTEEKPITVSIKGVYMPPQYPQMPYMQSMPVQQVPYQQVPIQQVPTQTTIVVEAPSKREKIEVTQLAEKTGTEILTKFKSFGATLVPEEDKKALKNIDITYALIPKNPKKGEPVIAYAHIVWNGTEPIYNIVEPPLPPEYKRLLEYIKKELEEKLDIDLSKIGEIKAKEILKKEVMIILDSIKDLDKSKIPSILYYIERDVTGLGPIHAFMSDSNIEDLSCDGIGIPIYAYHRDPRLGSLRTNIMFNTRDELDDFVVKLAQKSNKNISIAEPLLDGARPDGSRIQATLGTDIARKGSNFTIRKFTEKPLTPTHMLRYNTIDSTAMAYLWLAVENGRSMLVSGGTATGKTSFLNSLSLFIRPGYKVVSIEDTAELRLPLPHWIPQVARTPLAIKGKVGEITLFDLLKSSLRQRPDYIIVGEVRGKEAFVLFQQIATGHPSLATIHAATIPQLIDRLITPPISLPPSLIENVDIVVFLTLTRFKNHFVRRVNNILEVIGIKGDQPVTSVIFEWNPLGDNFKTVEKSVVLTNLARRMGTNPEAIQQEIVKRKRVLDWCLYRHIYDYKEFANIVATYYSDPNILMRMIEDDISKARETGSV